ncbi:hypothetical protein HJC23_003426 [Cyclotella cryptica]|uniref:Sulfotransferase domain-containing protein n=1 Tax=Cyclotella cryptica TaxID=29204 RepID=A0ABD3QU87_9STRA|eukprot:CCRYP_002556-RA/>CCRYP_002556-RA protein AED:0.25 eAED:0.25 QI:111/1/1/1/1/1/2/172/430
MHPLKQSNDSPQRRTASPRHLLQDQHEKFSPHSPLQSSPRATVTGASSVITSRRSPIILCMGLACLLTMEVSRWHRSETGSFMMSTIPPCENKNVWVSDASANNTRLDNDIAGRKDINTTDLDFAILGFPKTGTTFLIYALQQHPQVVMPPDGTAPYEFCQIHRKDGDQELRDWLNNSSSSFKPPGMPASVSLKRGIKCPTMVRAMNSIENLMKVSDATKLIVGVRHPVLWFQSFYNYRVYEKHTYPAIDPNPIPSPFTLNNQKEWRDVSTAYAKFDSYLKQLMKVPLSGKELNEMLATDAFWEKRTTPNPYKVFIYTSEQLNDKNATRQSTFRRQLQRYLDLETALVDFNTMPEMNKHDEVFPEYIDICNATYDRIRQSLLQSGKKSSEWILQKFIQSKDVFVGNRNYFVGHLKEWGVDPCKKRTRSNI